MHMSKTRPGRAPPLPRGRWCAPGRRLSSDRHPPFRCGQSLRPRYNIPSAGVTFTRRHQGFTCVRPSPPGGWLPPAGREAPPLPAGLLLACGPRMDQEPLRLLPRASHPAVTRDARQGGNGPRALARNYTFNIGRTSSGAFTQPVRPRVARCGPRRGRGGGGVVPGRRVGDRVRRGRCWWRMR